MESATAEPLNHLVVMSSEWPQMSFSFTAETPTDSRMSSASSIAEVTNGNDGSSLLSRVNDDSAEVHSKHWICVRHLSASTTDDELKKLFYPYGGDEAFTVWELSNSLAGYVGFELDEMASIAAEKMDAFIPCRQTHALAVRRVALDEVYIARSRVARENVRQPLWTLLQGVSPESTVTAALLSRLADPPQCALDVVAAVSRATPTGLRNLLAGLLTLFVQHLDARSQRFFDELLKELLRCLLDAGNTDLKGDGTARAVVNCGATLGNLFALRILPGDPFVFATRLLQRTGAVNVAQVNGICAVAHACHAMPFPISKASFWAFVGHSATEAGSRQLRDTLLAHLRQLRVVPQLPQVGAFSTQPHPPVCASTPVKCMQPQSMSASEAAAVADARLRTVHISHLPPQLPQRDFMDLLLRAGLVNKVRMCIGNGYKTLFAFVEMERVAGARAVTQMLNNVFMMGLCIRVQAARNAIQDVVGEDAVYSHVGATLKPCTFGSSTNSLIFCATPVQANERV